MLDQPEGYPVLDQVGAHDWTPLGDDEAVAVCMTCGELDVDAGRYCLDAVEAALVALLGGGK